MELNIQLQSEDGLHARPAGILAKTVASFTSNIEISARGMTKNAKSIMAVMSLGLKKDDMITFKATGDDAEAAISKIKSLFESNFSL